MASQKNDGLAVQGLPSQKAWRRKCSEKHELQLLTEYAAGSFSQTHISKLRSNNQCYNTEFLTQVKGHLDGWDGLYLKFAGSSKQEQRPGKVNVLSSRKESRAPVPLSILVI